MSDEAPVSRKEFEALEAEVIALAVLTRVLVKRERERGPVDTDAIVALFDQTTERWPESRRGIFDAAREVLVALLGRPVGDAEQHPR